MRTLAADEIARLICPRCSGPLEAHEDALLCSRCRGRYPVREGIADLRPWAGGDAGSEWSAWRDKLDKLQAWRRHTWDGTPRSGDTVARLMQMEQVICACFGVTEQAVRDALASGQAQSLEDIGMCLKAGTNCGSCKPELKRMIKHANALAG